MNRFLLTAVVLVVAAGVQAQVTKAVGLSVRGGVVFPTSGFGRDQGRTWFGVGGDYRISELNLGGMEGGYRGALSLSVDYYGKGDGSSVPVLLNYVGGQNEFFYSVGAGVAFTRDRENNENRNKTNFGYQVGLGYNFQQGQTPLFIEAKYFGNGNTRLNAFGVYLGIRL